MGTGGTVTTLVAILHELRAYDGARVHGATVARGSLLSLAERLSALPSRARRSLPGLETARADVICAGAWIVVETLDWANAQELVVSDRGVRWGLVRKLLHEA